ncbi:uncharacterized protein LOC124253764 [Haliotis rubra]|uniref:uncharacterized protein LOC124253764 n=1 Tax=Haliotis rubra TaxID=36100 RepID=UPI001EE61F5C|nr:uncharacterized protein LOC124253764 [Haliotis rubra]
MAIVHLFSEHSTYGRETNHNKPLDIYTLANDFQLQRHALDNIALGKPTNQSTTWREFVPDYAVDGQTGQRLFVDKCTHTLDTGEYQPWWEVDLTADYMVDSLRITNRVDCCAQRLANFNVSVGHVVGGHYQLCFFHQGKYGKTTKSISCSPNTVGRYLRIQLTGFERLTLCEVEVYGTLATFSSTLSSPLLSSYPTSSTANDQAISSHGLLATSEILQTDMAGTDITTSGIPTLYGFSLSTLHDMSLSVLDDSSLSILDDSSFSITDALDATQTSIQLSSGPRHNTTANTSPITSQVPDMTSLPRSHVTATELSSFQSSHFQTSYPATSMTASGDTFSTAAIPSSSTTTPDSSVTTAGLCRCRCQTFIPHDRELLAELSTAIKQKLIIPATNTSSYIRKKRSAVNKKPSAKYIGLFGIIIISFVSGLVVLPDLISVFRFVCMSHGRNRSQDV